MSFLSSSLKTWEHFLLQLSQCGPISLATTSLPRLEVRHIHCSWDRIHLSISVVVFSFSYFSNAQSFQLFRSQSQTHLVLLMVPCFFTKIYGCMMKILIQKEWIKKTNTNFMSFIEALFTCVSIGAILRIKETESYQQFWCNKRK